MPLTGMPFCRVTVLEQCIPRCTLPKRRKLPWVNSSIRRAISTVGKDQDKTPHIEININSLITRFYLCYVRGKGTFSRLLTPQTRNIFGKLWSSWMARPQHPSQSLSRTTYSDDCLHPISIQSLLYQYLSTIKQRHHWHMLP